MVRLAHDSGGPKEVNCQQVLGSDSPLEFDEDGYAHVDDEADAELIGAMFRHIRVEPAAPGPEPDSEPESESESESPFDPTEKTVAELKDALEDGDYSAGELDALRYAEAAGDDRDTALEAIDAALEE